MYLEALTVPLLCGISLANGFFHLSRTEFRFNDEQSFNQSILRSDPTQWIEQLVDHFNNTDNRTWKQKYYKVMKSWKPKGPILLSLCGEVGMTLDDLEKQYWNDYGGKSQSLIGQVAVETGAAFFMLGHRYYGDSQPFNKSSSENLAFLQSRQALADAAYLLSTIKKSPRFRNSKVIVVGGSYAGNLAAWMKLMYPELVDAVLSSSAPVLAKKDFYEYLEAVTDTFRTYGSQECVDEISERFKKLRQLFQSPEGIMQSKEEGYTCEDLNMIVTYITAAQYGTPATIAEICRVVKNCSNHDFALESDTLSRDSLQPDTPSDMRFWSYQSCTEFGYFASRTSSKQMFGYEPPIDINKFCKDSYGEEFDEKRVDQGVINTNRMYGGLSPNVTKVLFVNGDMDPWHKLGILQDLSADAPAIFIKGSSHHTYLNPDPSDTNIIKEARKRVKNLLKKWIGQA